MTQTVTTTKTQAQVKGWIRAAAVAAALMVATSQAHAQYKSSNNGRALDANNRVGSGGSNGEVDTSLPPTGNQIVTGNVTGGKEFRGPLGYRDSREFRGASGYDRSDRFVRDSSGGTRAPTLVRDPVAFYGNRLSQPVDSSFVPTNGATGGLVQSGRGNTGGSFDPAVGFAGVQPGRGVAGAFEQPQQFGGLDVSPLGVRPLQPNESPLDSFRNDPLNATSGDSRIATDNALAQMRAELNGSATGVAAPGTGADNGTDLTNPGGPGATDAGSSPAAKPLNAPLNNNVAQPGSQIQNNPLNSTVTNTPLNSGVTTGQQGATNRLVVPPAEQSAQYKELVRRMQNRTGGSDGQDANDFNRLRAAQAQGKQTAKPGDPQQQQQPGGPAAPGPKAPGGAVVPPTPKVGNPLPPEPIAGPTAPTEPLEVKSLATGVKASGLAGLLTSAEQSMRDQKYADAVGKYDRAARVAPNNPMITLGRGIAQLGGGNYGQADQAIRAALTAEPALLLGRYDLNGFYTDERAKFLIKDLKEVAAAGPNELRPRLLLAFLSYNTGNGPDTDKYLAEAVKLAPNDGVVQSMEKTWAVLGTTAPAKPAAPVELNK